MTVDFATFCHKPHLEKLHEPGFLESMIHSHHYPFDKIIVVHQRVGDADYKPLTLRQPHIIVKSEDYPFILTEFSIPEKDDIADEYTHGPTAKHYWKWHVINHLIALKNSDADYIVFSDADCSIKHTEEKSWVQFGIEILERFNDVLIVCPSAGAGGQYEQVRELDGWKLRLTQNVSQQLFLANRKRLSEIDFNIPWNWEYIAPGGPFQEYYYMLEGRIWRYMDKHNLYRAILPDKWRYWHYQW